MVSGDWPELESLVIATGVRMHRAHEAAATVSAVMQALTETGSGLSGQSTATDLAAFAERCAAEVAPVEAAAAVLETEMAAIAPGHDRILEIVVDDHDAVGVAEEYLGGARSFGAAADLAAEQFDTFSPSLERLGRTFPPVRDATNELTSATRRVVVALEPAGGWGERSAEILSDWD